MSVRAKKAPVLIENNGYRHELKYYLNRYDYVILSNNLRRTMDPDENANENNEYHVRSLYFDDHLNSALVTKLDGEDERTKYRIRIYNLSDSVIHLERKGKVSGYTHKDSVMLTREEVEEIIAGYPACLLAKKHPVANDMYLQIRVNGMRPVVVVDYIREAYVNPAQQVRVTFDKHLKTGRGQIDIFDKNLIMTPALEDYDMIFEVKFNESMPEYLRSLVQTKAAMRSAISKYAICRKYEL